MEYSTWELFSQFRISSIARVYHIRIAPVPPDIGLTLIPALISNYTRYKRWD